MFRIINSINDVDLQQLENLYAESLNTSPEQMNLYEQLQDCFADGEGLLCLWQVQGQFVSALRIEKYDDGVLIAGLETAPEHRGRGYAKALLSNAVSYMQKSSGVPIYSHVRINNNISLSVHKACGFEIHKESAVLLDGTVTQHYLTLKTKKSACM